VTITLLYRHCNNWFRHRSRMLICMPYFQYLYSFFPKRFAEHLRIWGGTQFENQTWESDLDNVDGSKKLKINPTWTKNSLRSNNKQNVLVYHLEDLRVPLVVRVPQVGNHWTMVISIFIGVSNCSESRIFLLIKCGFAKVASFYPKTSISLVNFKLPVVFSS